MNHDLMSHELAHPVTGEMVQLAPGDSFARMIGRAIQALDDARTLADTVRAMKLAKAAKELAKIANAANEARADCLRVEVLAQIRIVEEYDAAQKRGEVQEVGRPEKARDADLFVPTAKDLDLDKRRLSEWREMARVGEDAVLQVISDALDQGREPTKADICRAIKEGVGVNALRSYSGNNEYYTPARYIDAARKVMGGIDLDPASCPMAQETVRAKLYYTQEDDGLTKAWKGRVWLNPPYAAGLIDKFALKMAQEYRAGNVTAGIVLADNRTDTGWFYCLATACERICFTRGRINFYNENTASSSPANGSAFLYFGDDPDTFEEVFAQFGWVVPSPSAARRAMASISSATQTDKFGGEAA